MSEDALRAANAVADELEQRSQPGDRWLAIAARKVADEMANPLTVDVSDDVNRLLEDGPVDPQTWRDGHKLVDLGQGRPYALVENKVRLIDPDDAYAALNGSCQSVDDLADEWEVPETALLDLIAKSEVEQCTTCGWWCDKSELEIVDDEPTCEDCRDE